MKHIHSIIDLSSKDFYIKWRMTDLCNYNCSYCIRNKSKSRDKRHAKPLTKEVIAEEEIRMIDVAVKLNDMIEKISNQSVYLALIGGEVSVFNLERILRNLSSNKLKTIFITTNLSAESEYYISLYKYCISRSIKLILTASYHYEYSDMDEYFSKVNDIISAVPIKDCFTLEMPSVRNNQDAVMIFRDRCKKMGVKYSIEKDMRLKNAHVFSEKYNPNSCGKFLMHDGNSIIIAESKSDGLDVTGKRYLVIYDDGSEEIYKSRNEFLNAKEQVATLKAVKTGGYYCTNSVNFINVVYDKIVGRRYHTEYNCCGNCHEYIDINDFEPLDIENAICNMNGVCTLCGAVSISKNINVLKNIKYEIT